MLRRFCQLLWWILPALIIAAAWWGWWLFGDGPVNVSRPPEPIQAYLRELGRTGRTVVESATQSEIPESIIWRELETGRFIIPPGELIDVWTHISDNEETLIVTPSQTYHPGPIKLYDRSTLRMTELPVWNTTGWGWSIGYAGNRLVYESTDNSVIVVDLNTHKVTHRFQDLRAPLKLCPEGRFLVAPTDDVTLVMRDLDTGREFIRPPDKPFGKFLEIVVGPGGRRVSLNRHEIDDKGNKLLGMEIWSTDPAGQWQIPEPEWGCHANLKNGYFSIPTDVGPTCRLWDINTWPPKELLNRTGPMAAPIPRFSQDGKSVFGFDKTKKEWQVSDAQTFDIIRSGRMPDKWKQAGLEHHYIRIISDATPPGPWICQLIKMFPFLGQRSKTQLTFIDLSTSSSPRVIPRDRCFYSENVNFVWTTSASGDDGVYELWSLTPPRPPWWLWTLSALVGLWYGRQTMQLVAGRFAVGSFPCPDSAEVVAS